MYRFRVEYLKDDRKWETLVKEHRAILKALESRDKDEASGLITLHVHNQYLTLKQTLDSRGAEEKDGK